MERTDAIESILFAAGHPVGLSELAQATGFSRSQVLRSLDELAPRYQGGVRLVRDGTGAQLVTAPEAVEMVSRYHQSELRGNLSPAALETLAIVAYQGPVTRSEIETIRGVQSTASLRTLAIRGLVRESGRSSEVGRPILYETTIELLKDLGISSKEELPLLSPDQEAKLKSYASVSS